MVGASDMIVERPIVSARQRAVLYYASSAPAFMQGGVTGVPHSCRSLLWSSGTAKKQPSATSRATESETRALQNDCMLQCCFTNMKVLCESVQFYCAATVSFFAYVYRSAKHPIACVDTEKPPTKRSGQSHRN